MSAAVAAALARTTLCTRFTYVKPLPFGKAFDGCCGRCQVGKDLAGETAFEAAQGFGGGVAFGEAVSVVNQALAMDTDLGDGDAVQRGV